MIKEGTELKPDTKYTFVITKDFNEEVLTILRNNGYTGNFKKGYSLRQYTDDSFWCKRAGEIVWRNYHEEGHDVDNENIIRRILGVQSPYLLVKYADNENVACPICGETKCSYKKYVKRERIVDIDSFVDIAYVDITYACGHKRTL